MWQAQSFTTFQKMRCSFRGRRQHFGRVQRHFAWEGSYPGDGSQSHKYIYFVILCCWSFLSFCFFVISVLPVVLPFPFFLSFPLCLSCFCHFSVLAKFLPIICLGNFFVVFLSRQFCLSFFLVIDRKNYIFRIFARIAPQNCK